MSGDAVLVVLGGVMLFVIIVILVLAPSRRDQPPREWIALPDTRPDRPALTQRPLIVPARTADDVIATPLHLGASPAISTEDYRAYAGPSAPAREPGGDDGGAD